MVIIQTFLAKAIIGLLFLTEHKVRNKLWYNKEIYLVQTFFSSNFYLIEFFTV